MKKTKKPAKVMKVEEGERQHHVAPDAKLPIKTAIERLAEVSKELGLKVTKGLTPQKTRELLDERLSVLFNKAAPKLAEDPSDCFGKPDMRDPKHPECGKCVHLKECGKFVDAALAKMKDVVVNAEDEVDAEEEAEETNVEDVPKAKKGGGRKDTVTTVFLKASYFKEWPEDASEIEIVYHTETPNAEDFGEDTQEFIKLIYKKRPNTMSAWRKETMTFMKSPKSEANAEAVELLRDMLNEKIVMAKKV